jgi:hypothetical protein
MAPPSKSAICSGIRKARAENLEPQKGITMARSSTPHFIRLGAAAVGALALGACAIGALAIGRLAIGRLAVGRASLKSLRLDDLHIGRLHVDDLEVVNSLTVPKSAIAQLKNEL